MRKFWNFGLLVTLALSLSHEVHAGCSLGVNADQIAKVKIADYKKLKSEEVMSYVHLKDGRVFQYFYHGVNKQMGITPQCYGFEADALWFSLDMLPPDCFLYFSEPAGEVCACSRSGCEDFIMNKGPFQP